MNTVSENADLPNVSDVKPKRSKPVRGSLFDFSHSSEWEKVRGSVISICFGTVIASLIAVYYINHGSISVPLALLGLIFINGIYESVQEITRLFGRFRYIDEEEGDYGTGENLEWRRVLDRRKAADEVRNLLAFSAFSIFAFFSIADAFQQVEGAGNMGWIQWFFAIGWKRLITILGLLSPFGLVSSTLELRSLSKRIDSVVVWKGAKARTF